MMSLKRSTLFSVVVLAMLSHASFVAAQQPQAQFRPIYASQKASVMQTIGVTDITITYHRPAMKGRTIFADAPPSMEARATTASSSSAPASTSRRPSQAASAQT